MLSSTLIGRAPCLPRDAAELAWALRPPSRCPVATSEVPVPNATEAFCGEQLAAAVAGPQERTCESCNDCPWDLGEWTNCSATCGAGFRERSWTCSCSAADCPHKARTEGSAVPYFGVTFAFAAGCGCQCSHACSGSPRATRAFRCVCFVPALPRPSRCEDCPNATLERCEDYSSCSWRHGAWGSCSATCGPGLEAREAREWQRAGGTGRQASPGRRHVRSRIIRRKYRRGALPLETLDHHAQSNYPEQYAVPSRFEDKSRASRDSKSFAKRAYSVLARLPV